MSAESGWAPVRKVRTHEQVIAQIQEKILGGELTVGAKLPSERELVEALGVSRSSVREALRALEAMGIIEAQGGSGRDSGSVISGRSTEALGNLLRLHVVLAGISLEELVDIRVQLERHAVSGAAEHRSEEDIEHLRSVVGSMRPEQVSSTEFNELDTEFHVSIARASSNGLVVTLMQALRDAVKAEMVRAFTAIEDWRAVGDKLVAEHGAIVDAIEARHGKKGADLVERHIRTFYRDQLAAGS
ncbi:FadR family transcriptional regulator [Amycolatopsis acidicola]|uniref:FadR family transcriptional regulator n=1 Tax=Amycolatopsis acidicola TaxID=2596893 RepID=A0A5N0V8A0_9PSEU|nr:FadR/GntR family transcriptional regulator [Amycolatopsis acidicola]KAA9162626.1 FadR family transcriptional regulator [Amycolatopsis acidicola]